MTAAPQKQGEWSMRYVYQDTLHLVSIVICKPGKNFISAAYGDLISHLLDEMQNGPDIKQYCELFDLIIPQISKFFNEIAQSAMKSASQTKLNPPTRRRGGFHPLRRFHHRR